MKNLASFQRPKNGDLILESKMAKLTQNKNSWFNFRKQNGKNKNSKQPDQTDAAWKFYSTLEINE